MSGKMKTSITFSVPIVIEKDNGEYHAFCPVLKGLHTRGETIKETKTNAANAVIAYLNSLIRHGDPIPLCIIKEEKPSKGHLIEYTENLIEVTV